MLFYIVLAMLGCFILLLFCYAHAHLEIELYEEDHVQGIKLHIDIPFYKYQQSYDYSDPKLHLLEAVLVDRINSGLHDKLGFNLAALEAVLKKIPHLYHISRLERDSFSIFKKALAFTVVEKLEWKTTVGASDAMQTALHTGYLWAFKSWIIAFISTQSQLKHLQLVVEPDFVKSIFLSKFTCILKMRIVHIITIAIYILVWKVRWWMNGITAGPAEQPSH